MRVKIFTTAKVARGVESPPMEIFKACLDTALSNLT